MLTKKQRLDYYLFMQKQRDLRKKQKEQRKRTLAWKEAYRKQLQG